MYYSDEIKMAYEDELTKLIREDRERIVANIMEKFVEEVYDCRGSRYVLHLEDGISDLIDEIMED